MSKKRRSSLRKSMAFLVCVCFIFIAFPEVTHAATKPSSERFPFPERTIRLISATFSFASLNSSLLGYDLALFSILSKNRPKLPKQAKNGRLNGNGQMQNGSFIGHGTSTSKKTPKGKDDD